MTTYTVQCVYAFYYGAVVTVEAESSEAACAQAIEHANDESGIWKAFDQPGPTFVERIARGDHDDPWAAPAGDAVPTPPEFTEMSILSGGNPAAQLVVF